jgi:phage baseplate assembly protein W
MATISFKSVGQTNSKLSSILEKNSKDPLPIGIRTPLKLSTTNGLLTMSYDFESQVSDNLRNLLLTNWGERLGQYYLGANLKPLTTELNSQTSFDNEAVVRIKAAVDRWMPYVDLVDFMSKIDRLENSSTGVFRITITYNIPSINVNNKKLQMVLYVL